MIDKRDQRHRGLPVSPLMTIEETADYLTVSKQTVKRWLREGTLNGVKLPGGHWRVLREQCVDLITKHLRQSDN